MLPGNMTPLQSPIGREQYQPKVLHLPTGFDVWKVLMWSHGSGACVVVCLHRAAKDRALL